MITGFQNLLNAASKAMNVDGSSVAKTFTYSPGDGFSAAITGLVCLLKDDGTTNFGRFGAITTVTNGLLLQTTISSVTRTLTNILDNADFCTRFHYNQFGNGAVLSLLGVTTPVGFGNSNNVFVGFMEFQNPIILTGTDSIDAVVRDNLTNIDLLQIGCKIVQD